MTPPHLPNTLILASSSPYRQALLSRLRIPFQVKTPAIDETPLPQETPEKTALRLAHQKAQAVAAEYPAAHIIGSDQVATLDGQAIGKPGSHEKALAQLQWMRGRTVNFHSALCLYDSRTGQYQLDNVQTRVRFRHLPDTELEAYLQIERPYDCAGSAKVEGLGIVLLEQVESDDPSALIGLPLIALTRMLRTAGFPLLGCTP